VPSGAGQKSYLNQQKAPLEQVIAPDQSVGFFQERKCQDRSNLVDCYVHRYVVHETVRQLCSRIYEFDVPYRHIAMGGLSFVFIGDLIAPGTEYG
jgi:hypothetical protein